MKAVSVNEEVEQAQTLVAERISLSRVQLVQALDPDIQPVKFDRMVLRHSFASMILTAVRLLRGIGVVTIVTGNNSEDAVEVSVSAIGKPECPDAAGQSDASGRSDILRRKGMGLPLSVVRDIIEGQGGTVSWTDDGDGNAKFSLLLPGTRRAEVAMRS